jgi:hypothetical protein
MWNVSIDFVIASRFERADPRESGTCATPWGGFHLRQPIEARRVIPNDRSGLPGAAVR